MGQQMINARSETLLEKPSFRQAVQKRRCLIPANGFYEWRRDGKRKVPMWVQFKNRERFAFAGLWDCWIDHETGKPLYTFTIITTHANALLRPVHDRMPVIYRKDIGRQWLEDAPSHDLELQLRTQPVLSEELEAYEVSTLVNSPEIDSPECLRRVPRLKAEFSFSTEHGEKPFFSLLRNGGKPSFEISMPWEPPRWLVNP